MEISIMAVLVATVAQFAVGAIWYMPLFGKLWAQIHGIDKLSKKELKEMQNKMGPYYFAQIVFTALSTYVLAHFMRELPEISAYELVQWLWLGFVIPTQVSAVIFGGTEGKWILKKILVMAFGTLACLLVGAFILEKMM